MAPSTSVSKLDHTVQIVCLLHFDDDDHRLTATEAKTIEVAIKDALHAALPSYRRTGLWVHQAADFEWRPTIRPVPTSAETRALALARIVAIATVISGTEIGRSGWRTYYEGLRRREVR